MAPAPPHHTEHPPASHRKPPSGVKTQRYHSPPTPGGVAARRQPVSGLTDKAKHRSHRPLHRPAAASRSAAGSLRGVAVRASPRPGHSHGRPGGLGWGRTPSRDREGHPGRGSRPRAAPALPQRGGALAAHHPAAGAARRADRGNRRPGPLPPGHLGHYQLDPGHQRGHCPSPLHRPVHPAPHRPLQPVRDSIHLRRQPLRNHRAQHVHLPRPARRRGRRQRCRRHRWRPRW